MNAIRAAENGPFHAVVFDELKKLDYPAERLTEARFFIEAFFERIAPADHALHAPARWAALIADLLAFARERTPGKAKVRVYNPGVSGTRAVVEVVTDDMPFLVDTVSMVAAAHADIHAIIHPVVPVVRSASGALEAMGTGEKTESIMRFEIDRIDDTELDVVKANVETALSDVREAVDDWRAMRGKMVEIADDLGKRALPYTAEEVREASEFLRWVADEHFTFMGYREYEVAADAGDEVLKTVEGSGLGILRAAERSLAPRSLRTLVASELPRSGSTDAIILTKTNARSPMHRAGYMDYVGVLRFDDKGRPVAEQRFLGLFSSNAYMAHPQHVPLVREKCEAVMTRSGLKRDSHSGKALRHILDTLPRDELFQCSTDELFALSMGLLELAQRTRTRLFIRRDSYGRFFSCLVYIPRDRFNTSVRERVENVLREAFHGEHVDSAVLMGEAALVRLHVVVRPRIGDHPVYDAVSMEAQIASIARNWYDEARDRLIELVGEQQGIILANRYGKALPAGYVDEVAPQIAAADVRALAGLDGPDAISMSFYHPPHRPEELRFKVYRSGSDIALSEVLPQLENLGLRVLTEHMYEVKLADGSLFIQDFEVQPVGRLAFEVEQVGSIFEDAFEQIWRGNAENDGFNRLVLGAKLGWRQVAVLRSYCKYLLQTGVAFSQAYMEDALNRYPAIAGLIIELFNVRFDPRRESLDGAERERAESLLSHEMHALMDPETLAAQPGLIGNLVASLSRPRAEQMTAVEEAINALLENVSSLDEDRILRSFIALVHATLRTSFYQAWDGAFRPYISFKFDSHKVPDLAKPVPFREIFVYAPRVEGIHLRFGSVARGGLRWSDRREDFRTEVLGLVKAQMVKNTVIVPVGSKGGFFVKRPPTGGDRDAQLAEGIACYRMFINGLLDITDNLVEGKVVPPHDVVRHDNDDPYLVVAADKGTATFSDIANAISTEHGFWLDDAFASGGSNGYDHKGMGITAKGAWESVKRHFREM
ncbi:MAG TPA: NAD-glutamate dehydrogenase domain-containing protein, partial [Luteibacter sp.]|nr:NAD-glutamate dehydrogenase domain-containing protein [Luteibacter sp.]